MVGYIKTHDDLVIIPIVITNIVINVSFHPRKHIFINIIQQLKRYPISPICWLNGIYPHYIPVVVGS